jgi:hypothetical protein
MKKMHYILNGVYDLRTLKFLKNEGFKSFGFEFNPRSFNFIQEYKFLELYKNVLDEFDTVFLHFISSDDLMISKLILDMKIIRPMENVFFVFDNITLQIADYEIYFIAIYNHNLTRSLLDSNYFKGLILDHSIIEDTYNQAVLQNFCSNLMLRFPIIFNDDFKLILNLQWTDNIISSMFDFLEINAIQFNLNSDVEICYRNVDFTKLKSEFSLKKKYLNF